MRTQTTRTIAGRVNADGTPASGGEFTSRKTATGQYVVTTPGLRLVAFTADAAGFMTMVVNNTAPPLPGQSVALQTLVSNTGTATDVAFQFVATVAL